MGYPSSISAFVPGLGSFGVWLFMTNHNSILVLLLKPENHWLLVNRNQAESFSYSEIRGVRPCSSDLVCNLFSEVFYGEIVFEMITGCTRRNDVFQLVSFWVSRSSGVDISITIFNGLAFYDYPVQRFKMISMPSLFWQRIAAIPAEAA
jgi:hypothetical protein